MKNKLIIRNLILSSLMILGLSFLVTSCVKDDLIGVDENDTNTIIKLNILSNSEVITRTSDVVENSVNSGYVFVYDTNDTQKGNYTLQSSDIINKGESTQEIKVPIKIANGDKVVVVFNAVPAANLDLNSVTIVNMDASFPLGDTGFESVAAGLPMYGTHTWSATGNTITVKRSVAKLQVMIDANISGAHSTDFNTTNVKYQLFNYAVNGKVTPNVTAGVANGSDLNKAPETSITFNDIDAKQASAKTDNFTGASYIYEYVYSKKIIGETSSTVIAENTSSKNRLAVILKNSKTDKYYRLDLLSKDASFNIKYIDILRNHHYKIVIKEVNSEGYATPTDALNGDASNIEYEIIDDTGNTTISNGRYAISVGEELFAGKFIYGSATQGTRTYDVANNVRYILHAGITAPSVNMITVVKEDGTAISGSSVWPNKLTADLENLLITLPTTVAMENIRFKIELGVLEYLSEPFTLKLIRSMEFDCHERPASVRTVDINPDDINWDGVESPYFTIVKDVNSFTIAPKGENVTPIAWETWNGSSYDRTPTEKNDDSIPLFEDKSLTLTLHSGVPNIMFTHLAPIYIGRWGSPTEDTVVVGEPGSFVQLTGVMGKPLRKRAIIEAREEADLMKWSSLEANQFENYNELNNGLKISKYSNIGSNVGNFTLNECYKKNKDYATGVALAEQNVKWYLPAQQQLSGVWVALNEVGYSGGQALITGGDYRTSYWTATEHSSLYSWSLFFGSGTLVFTTKAESYRVRCIMDL